MTGKVEIYRGRGKKKIFQKWPEISVKIQKFYNFFFFLIFLNHFKKLDWFIVFSFPSNESVQRYLGNGCEIWEEMR